MKIYFFGCWNEPGHYMWLPGGKTAERPYPSEYYGPSRAHLDGTLAPRRVRNGTATARHYGTDTIMWSGTGTTRDDRRRIDYDSEECPQGQFMRHELDNGYTAIQWWDRTQGDSRGACNSTLLAEGRHTSEEMVDLLKAHFPHVIANMTKAQVTLVEVSR